MPCYQQSGLPYGVTTTGRTSYTTEAECNQACREGACCEGTSCSVKPQCQCQGTGKTFKGVGTTCSGVCCITGRCCGPETFTDSLGLWRVCEQLTKEQCDQKGGQWECNNCSVLGDDKGVIAGSERCNPLP